MKRTAIFLLCIVLLVAAFAGCNKTTPYDDVYTSSGDGTGAPADTENDGGETELLSGKHYVEIDVKDYGVIKCELDADTAPVTVTNFIGLVEDGFYDGITFHRIVDKFMVQGGDPKGTGGSEKTIKGEFSENGVENNISHVRGAISMARSSNPNSASSQFFIVHEDSTFLDGQYAAFGMVTEGIEVVDALCKAVAGWETDSMGVIQNKDEQPVINSIKVIEG